MQNIQNSVITFAHFCRNPFFFGLLDQTEWGSFPAACRTLARSWVERVDELGLAAAVLEAGRTSGRGWPREVQCRTLRCPISGRSFQNLSLDLEQTPVPSCFLLTLWSEHMSEWLEAFLVLFFLLLRSKKRVRDEPLWLEKGMHCFFHTCPADRPTASSRRAQLVKSESGFLEVPLRCSRLRIWLCRGCGAGRN